MTRSEQSFLECLYEVVNIKDIPEIRQEVYKQLYNPALLAKAITAMAKSGISKEIFTDWLVALEEIYPKEVRAAKEHKRKIVELKKNPTPVEEPEPIEEVPPSVDMRHTVDDTPLTTTDNLGLGGVLTRIVDSGLLKTEKDPAKLREDIIKQINGSRCSDNNKFVMMKVLSGLDTVEKISQYVINAMFKHNKLGVINKQPKY